MKKKLLFTSYSMGLGGIETALTNLLKRLDYKKYDVTLILQKKEGDFLSEIPKNVKVLEYKISESKFLLFRKIYNRCKLISWQRKLKNKFDFACSFSTYDIPGAYLALAGSENNTLWMHGNYYILYKENEKDMQDFLNTVFVKKFKRLVFVSEENKRDVCNHYPGLEEKALVCNNFINGDDILKKMNESCDYKRDKDILFVNVGRHDEYQKRLSRIIKASEKLIEEKYKFKILFIGDGPDNEMYKNMVKESKLEDTIIFLGRKNNPFPYYKMSDAVILSSEYEGYPVVFLEAMLVGKPLLSTKVSDWEDLDNVYGMFCDRDEESVYQMVKKYLDNGFELKEKFDYKKYNDDIEKKIEKMIDNKSR